MRAMVVRRYGPPEVFEWQEDPDPQPKAGEVLIRVKAVGINFADLLQRMGIYPGTPKPPFVPGLEISGVVEKAATGGMPGEGDPCVLETPLQRSRHSMPTPNGLPCRPRRLTACPRG